MKNIQFKKILFLTLILSSSKLSKIYCDDVDKLFESCEDVEPPTAPLPGEECIDAEGILCLITPPSDCHGSSPFVNVPLILQENLYKRTTGPVNIRSLLDQPSLIPYVYGTNCWQFSGQLFYNYTPRVYVTKCSPAIVSYIDLTNQNIINELSNIEFIKADVPGILGLFHNVTFQQHRVGAMFGFAKEHNRFMFDFRLPLYYLVEHFFLCSDDQRAIENAFETDPTEEVAGNSCSTLGPKEDVDKFGLNHLACDKLGTGDTRFSALYDFINTENTKLYLGFQTTIPTAKAFKKGLLTGKFNNCMPIPPFNIKRYFNLYLCAQSDIQARFADQTIKSEISDFLIGALDRLSTILINAPLGNGHHWGGGPQIDLIHKFDSCITMHTYGAVEFFKTTNETRYFLITKNPEDFQRDWRDPETAEENLTFLNQQMINTLYPIPICAKITPGILFKFNHEFMYDTTNWHMSLGFDFWQQQKEKMKIKKCYMGKVDFEKAQKWLSRQGKFFTSIGYKDTGLCDTFDWDLLFTFDGTVFNSGIGQNYTFGLKLGLYY